jgi:hypothetical protein
MESFKGMLSSGDMNSSSDTIGTIEGLMPSLGGGMSIGQMSGISTMSMNMSTDSFPVHKLAEAAKSNPTMDGETPKKQQSDLNTTSSSSGSMSTSDLWNSNQLHSLMHGPLVGSTTNFAAGDHAAAAAAAAASAHHHHEPPPHHVFDINRTASSSSSASPPQQQYH